VLGGTPDALVHFRAVIPYLEEPVFRAGGFSLSAFQILVFAGVIAGCEIVVRRAGQLGWDRGLTLNLVLWTILSGFIGSHLLDTLLYEREALRENPLVLLQIWGTMSSFGGLLGGIAGGWWITRRKGLSGARIFAFFDIVAYAFPFAWIFGRAGCAVAHDHVGVFSSSFLAVDFPGGPRFDLGLLELIWTLVIAGIFLWVDRRQRPTGTYLGLFFALYGPVRFALDVLRTGDERYLGWTPGQYASIAATIAGAALLRRVSVIGKAGCFGALG
jgi:phosphatidylglycerol:prolipoprotein diacylglycerol transferase